jgi:hypothetical protein
VTYGHCRLNNHIILIWTPCEASPTRRPPAIWCLVLGTAAPGILHRARTEIITEGSDNWAMPPAACCALHYICSGHTHFCNSKETKADTLCAVKCWMLAVRHNKHIAVNTNRTAPYATAVLCLVLLDTYRVSGNLSWFCWHQTAQFNLQRSLVLFTWKGDGVQTLPSRYTDGNCNDTLADIPAVKF